MLRPLFMQKFAAKPFALSLELRYTLVWWRTILADCRVEKYCWKQPDKSVVHLFCDAAGSPARIAAIAWIDGKLYFADCAPPQQIVERWEHRTDSQIMGLELLSIALALSTFQRQCKGRRVIVHSDNRGAECCLRKGSAKQSDHCYLVNAVWAHALRKSMRLWIVRVPTSDNWADSPSREVYSALEVAGAIQCKPRLASCYALQCASQLCEALE